MLYCQRANTKILEWSIRKVLGRLSLLHDYGGEADIQTILIVIFYQYLGHYCCFDLQKFQHPTCYFQDPLGQAAFSFEHKDSQTLLSGTFASEEGSTYVIQSYDLYDGAIERATYTSPKSSQDYIIYKMTSGGRRKNYPAGTRHKKAVIQQNYVEVLAVIDYSLYKR